MDWAMSGNSCFSAVSNYPAWSIERSVIELNRAIEFDWVRLSNLMELTPTSVSDCGTWRSGCIVTLFLFAALLRSRLSHCPGFNKAKGQTTRLSLETNDTAKMDSLNWPGSVSPHHKFVSLSRHFGSLKIIIDHRGAQISSFTKRSPCSLCIKAVRSNQKATECEECLH